MPSASSSNIHNAVRWEEKSMALKGMFALEFFRNFSETDETKFEEQIVKWTRKYTPNPVLFFDRNYFKVGETIKVDNYTYRVKLPRICIEYIAINEKMCILLKVTQTDDNNKIIYQIPMTWNGISPWLADE